MTREEILQIAKPVLFNTKMVKAILNGKTVTRRVIKFPVNRFTKNAPVADNVQLEQIRSDKANFHEAPFYGFDVKLPCSVGDILYVRETWNHYTHDIVGGSRKGYHEEGYFYKASPEMKSTLPDYVQYHWGKKWKPSIHMPKEAARIFLKVNDVRVERLQEINPEHIRREGISLSILPSECKD